MARRRTYSITSPIRHKAKMARLLGSGVPEQVVLEFVDTVNAEWLQKFGEYRALYQDFLNYIKGKVEIPVGLRGLARSGLFKCYKVRKTGGDVDACLEEYRRKTGLPVEVIEAIRDYLTHAARTPEAATPSK